MAHNKKGPAGSSQKIFAKNSSSEKNNNHISNNNNSNFDFDEKQENPPVTDYDNNNNNNSGSDIFDICEKVLLDDMSFNFMGNKFFNFISNVSIITKIL